MKNRYLVLLILVLIISPEYSKANIKKSDGSIVDSWNIEMINATDLWQFTTGNGIIVAVIDTGIDYNHPDLKDNIWINSDEIPNGIDDDENGYIDDYQGWNFVSDTNNILDDNDVSHGTHVSGTIAGSHVGVASNVTIMPLKAFNFDGDGEYEDLTSAIYYAVNNGADIISMSLGGAVGDYYLSRAINYADSRGVFMLAAAGNAGRGAIDYPAKYSSVIAVGSVDKLGLRSSFSNYGSDLALMAPGNAINSTSRISKGLNSELIFDGNVIETIPFEYSSTSFDYETIYLVDGGDGSNLNNSIDNKLVLIRRGKMIFSDMAKSVSDLGGYGMIVYNNQDDIFAGTIQSQSDIKAVSISRMDGEFLLERIDSNISLEINIKAGNYSYSSGTSMATPHVSGLLALLLSYNRTMNSGYSYDEIIKILEYSSQDVGVTGKDSIYGWGIVDGETILTLITDIIKPEVHVTVIAEGESFGSAYINLQINISDNHALSNVRYGPVENGSVVRISEFDDTSLSPNLTFLKTEFIEGDYILFQVNATDWAFNEYTSTFRYDTKIRSIETLRTIIIQSNETTEEVTILGIIEVILIIQIIRYGKKRYNI